MGTNYSVCKLRSGDSTGLLVDARSILIVVIFKLNLGAGLLLLRYYYFSNMTGTAQLAKPCSVTYYGNTLCYIGVATCNQEIRCPFYF